MTAPVHSPAEPMTALLDQLDELRAAATPGEWHVATGGGIDAGDYDTVIGRGDVDCMAHCYGGTSTLEGDNLAPDAALIVAAVNALPKLTAALRAALDPHEPAMASRPGGGLVCTGCSDPWPNGNLVTYPCADVAAITAALTPEQVQP